MWEWTAAFGRPVEPEVYPQYAMSSRTVGVAGSEAGAFAISASSCPTPTTARSQRHRLRRLSTFGRKASSTTTTFARLSSRMNAYSSTVMRVFRGTATAPSFKAPQNVAANAGVSWRTSTTRFSTSTPSPASA